MIRQSSVLEDACTLCFDRPSAAALHPCGHSGICVECAAQLERCPLCRAKVASVVEVEEKEEGVEKHK